MENKETAKPGDQPQLKEAKSEDWVKLKFDELKIRIDTYRFYLNLTLQINGFFYLTTGAVLGFYLKEPNEYHSNSHLVYFLWLPILIGAVLGAIFIYGARLQETASRSIEAIRKDLNNTPKLVIKQIPDIHLLRLLLLIFGTIFFFVIASLIVVPPIIASISRKDWIIFGVVGGIIFAMGLFLAFFILPKIAEGFEKGLNSEEAIRRIN